MAHIKTVDQLREVYAVAKGRPLEKVLHKLEQHSRRFIELSPFLVISSTSGDKQLDASPRGEGPGFVKILDDSTLAIPDRPGNNRLDTLSNFLEVPNVGLIFLIPGVNETLRINGTVEIRDDDDLRQLFEIKGRLPATVLVVKIDELYLHCAKSLMRSNLWSEDTKIDRKDLPTMGRMINDQLHVDEPGESQESMAARYEKQLY